MRKVANLVGVIVGFLLACISAALLVTFRYMLRTPQPLDSILPGEAHLYKWRCGHIYYKVAGPLDAPVLLLCHAPGIGASGYEMRYLVEDLARDYRVYTLDLLGFGLSDHPHVDYTAELYVTLYQDFLREVVQQPATLLGSGLSCNYCVAVADRVPALCQRLILVTPEAIFAAPRRMRWSAILASNQLVSFVFYALVTSRPLLRIIVNRSHGLDGSHSGADEWRSRFAVAHQFHAQHAALALLTGKLDLEVAHRLPDLRQPVQIIWGERAALALPRPPANALRLHVDTISGSKCFPHEEQPERVVACIRAHDAQPQGLLQSASVTTAIALPSDETGETSVAVEHVEESHEQEAKATNSTSVGTVAPTTNSTNVAEQAAGEEAVAAIQEGVTAYCFKCKQKREIQNAQRITTPKGRRAMEGTCPVCGTRLFRFVAG